MFNWTLGRKFSAFLALLALLGCCLTTYILSCHFNQQAEKTVRERTEILLNTMQAARNYTRDQIQPLLELDSEAATAEPEHFQRESVPNFAARTIFADFRDHSPDFQDFLYKEAAINPTNPADKTDPFETELLTAMQAEQEQTSRFNKAAAQKRSGYRTVRGEKLFYLAKPLVMDSPKCLTCHGHPSDAPAKLLEMYGSEGGFNWSLNSVVATQMMYVPASRIFDRGRENLFTVTKILLSIFGAIFVVINLLLWRAVSHPLEILTHTAKQISSCPVNSSSTQALPTINVPALSQLSQRRDEPGQLARALEYMLHILSLREQDLQQAVAARTQSLEQEMRDRQTAQAGLQTYGRAVNHDLRNMVMGIANLLQVFEFRRAQQNDASPTVVIEAEALEMMQKSCDRQLRLIDSLTEVQSTDLWRGALHLEPVDFMQLCQDLQPAYAAKLRQAQAELSLILSNELPIIQADPVQIQRVFENLLGNALKYNPKGVKIQIEARISDGDAQQIQCIVSDDGVGLSNSHRLFAPFARGNQAEQASGQGLGLYICRQIIEAHGGEISGRPSAQGGAAFWFTLGISKE